MRRFLLAASLLALLAPAASAATALDAAPADAVEAPDADGDAWFRMWCWDHEIIATTPGTWAGACAAYVSGCLPGCKPRPPRSEASDASATCLNGDNYASKVRNCLYSVFVTGGWGVRMICLDRTFEDGSVQGVTWKCVDYQVFEKVVCTEVRC